MERSNDDGRGPAALPIGIVRDLLVRFVKDETATAGFQKVVVGLSGGVDSAVVAAVAVEALGPANVLAVLMPHRQSNDASRVDAMAVVERFGLRHEIVDITPLVDGFIAAAGPTGKVALGNVMARTRMIILYDRSARNRALVLGTSNKTELLLGYGTLHGDLASALNPVGDLYKTQVWMLAKELGVPDTVIRKKPSADLWAGQTDEGDLGFTYADVDRLLFAMIDERRTDQELRASGFAVDFIARVRELVRVNQFKRRPPLIAKLSGRTINVDFRYVRDWGM